MSNNDISIHIVGGWWIIKAVCSDLDAYLLHCVFVHKGSLVLQQIVKYILKPCSGPDLFITTWNSQKIYYSPGSPFSSHWTTKALTFSTPKMRLLALLALVAPSVICTPIVCSLATALKDWGGLKNYSPLFSSVPTSKALRTLSRQVSQPIKQPHRQRQLPSHRGVSWSTVIFSPLFSFICHETPGREKDSFCPRLCAPGFGIRGRDGHLWHHKSRDKPYMSSWHMC